MSEVNQNVSDLNSEAVADPEEVFDTPARPVLADENENLNDDFYEPTDEDVQQALEDVAGEETGEDVSEGGGFCVKKHPVFGPSAESGLMDKFRGVVERLWLRTVLSDTSNGSIGRSHPEFPKFWPEQVPVNRVTDEMRYTPKVYWKENGKFVAEGTVCEVDLNGRTQVRSRNELADHELVWLVFSMEKCAMSTDSKDDVYRSAQTSHVKGWRIASALRGLPVPGFTTGADAVLPQWQDENVGESPRLTACINGWMQASIYDYRYKNWPESMPTAPAITVKLNRNVLVIKGPKMLIDIFEHRDLGYLTFKTWNGALILFWSTLNGYPEFLLLDGGWSDYMEPVWQTSPDLASIFPEVMFALIPETGWGRTTPDRLLSSYGRLSLSRTPSKEADYRATFLVTRMFDSLRIYKRAGETGWHRYRHNYKHWPIAKKNKPGSRLISAPQGLFKRVTGKVHEILSQAMLKEREYMGLYSYLPGTDYPTKLAKNALSIEKAGRFILEIDFKDYFTNITPRLLGVAFSRLTYPMLCAVVKAATKMFGFVPIMPRVSRRVWALSDYDHAAGHNTLFKLQTLANAFTTTLPLWKRDLNGLDLLALDGSPEEHSVEKMCNGYRDEIVHEHDLSEIRAYHQDHFGGKPFLQKGVPQGACFSGDIANIVSTMLGKMLRGFICSFMRDLKWTGAPEDVGVFDRYIPSVTPVVYSDNLYLFYKADDNIHGMFLKLYQAELDRAADGSYEWMGAARCTRPFGFSTDQSVRLVKDLRKLISFKKIMGVDREKQDVKVLGLIIDRDGNIRLSRQMKRRLNQDMIHRRKNRECWTQSDSGRRVWYDRVNELCNGQYSRGLLSEKYPDKFGFARDRRKKKKQQAS